MWVGWEIFPGHSLTSNNRSCRRCCYRGRSTAARSPGASCTRSTWGRECASGALGPAGSICPWSWSRSRRTRPPTEGPVAHPGAPSCGTRCSRGASRVTPRVLPATVLPHPRMPKTDTAHSVAGKMRAFLNTPPFATGDVAQPYRWLRYVNVNIRKY